MQTLVVTEVRVYKEGNKYYADNSFAKILERYAQKFPNIKLMTRVMSSSSIPSGFSDISANFKEIVNVGSLAKFLLKISDEEIKNIVKQADFVILRLHSVIAFKIYKYIKKFHKKYMVEVMGCAWDAYWNHGLKGKIIAPYAYFKMKKIIKNANYATYVTSKFLQNRYPCANSSINASNVSINKSFTHKDYKNIDKTSISMFTAAAVNVKYKGQQYVIKAIKKLKKKGINVKYYLAGKGDNSYLKKVASRYGVSDCVFFLGALSKEEVLEKMQNVDFYIQPSLQEGLPRSMIEAMSCGCVCLGARTAGIPELIDSEFVFKRKNVNAIVNKVIWVLDCNLNDISRKNIEKSKLYFEDNINKRRFDYYDKIVKKLEK